MQRTINKFITLLSILLLFYCFVNKGLPQVKKIRVAVLDLEVAGIDTTTIISLSNRLRAELLQTGQFDVMERNRMEELLFEQGFQQTGACSSDECLVEAGKILGVSQMVAGSVGRVGNLFATSIRMIDVATGRILFTVTEDTPGPVENVLTTTLRNIVKNFAARAASRSESLIGFGTVKLISEPSGARIFFDNQTIPELTPATLDSISAGVHVVRFQKGILAASKAIFVAPDEQTRIELPLTESKGNLKIVTEPEAAEIFLDYQLKGFSPHTLLDLPVGSYHLKLVKEGYVDHTQIISISENDTRVISARMIQMAHLSLTTNPLECEILIDDSLYGASPVTALVLKPGFHKIQVRKKHFVTFEEVRSLPTGEQTNLEITLDPAATLNIQSEPPEVELLVNGISKGSTPIIVTDVKPGVVKLKLQHPRYEDFLTQLVIEKGETKNLDFTLTKKVGMVRVASIPSGAQVEIDGVAKGKTPLEIRDLEYGTHLVRVTKSGYTTYEQQIEIDSHLPQEVNPHLTIAKGTLFLIPKPNDAFIYLNGRLLDQVPASGLKLFPGDYHLSASRPGYEGQLKRVQITPNEGISLQLELPPKTKQKAMLRSLLFPGLGQRYGEKYTRQYVFSILEISTLAGILISDLIYDAKVEDYTTSRDEYLNAISEASIISSKLAMDDAYNDLETVKNWRQTFVVAAVGTWILSILDAAIFKPICPLNAFDAPGSHSGSHHFFFQHHADQWSVGLQFNYIGFK